MSLGLSLPLTETLCTAVGIGVDRVCLGHHVEPFLMLPVWDCHTQVLKRDQVKSKANGTFTEMTSMAGDMGALQRFRAAEGAVDKT